MKIISKLLSWSTKVRKNQRGSINIASIITTAILGIIGLVIIGNVLINMWPVWLTNNAAVQVLTTANTDIGTKIWATIWPYVGLGLIASICIGLLIKMFHSVRH